MIEMKSPSFAFNSVDVPGPSYRMWEWIVGYKGMSTATLVDQILWAEGESRRRKGKPLLNIIINAHGLDGGGAISVGGRGVLGLNNKSVSEFLRLRFRSQGTIWLVACQAAAGSFGKELCQMIATNSRCQVVASDEDQEVGAWGTWRLWTSARYDHIDEYEGTVYSFRPYAGMKMIDPHEDISTTTDYE